MFLRAMNAYKEYIDPEQNSVYGKIINDVQDFKIMSRIFRNYVSIYVFDFLVSRKV